MAIERQLLGQEKTCTKCGLPKDLSEFYERPEYKDGRYSWCIECFKTRRTDNYDPQAAKRVKYGIDFNVMWAKQQGLCAVCGEPMLPRGKQLTSVVVDHDHACCAGRQSCGECVRGQIHKQCNNLLGASKDNFQVLRKAADYLEQWRRSQT